MVKIQVPIAQLLECHLSFELNIKDSLFPYLDPSLCIRVRGFFDGSPYHFFFLPASRKPNDNPVINLIGPLELIKILTTWRDLVF